MIVVMKSGAAKKDRDEVTRRIKELGYTPHIIHGTTRDVIGAVGDERGKSVLKRDSLERAEHYVHQLQKYTLQATMERDE